MFRDKFRGLWHLIILVLADNNLFLLIIWVKLFELFLVLLCFEINFEGSGTCVAKRVNCISFVFKSDPSK